MKNIKKLGVSKLIPLVLILLMFILLNAFNQSRKTILVLQSYNTDYSWTNDVNTGIKKIFDKEELFKVQYHYMDTKRQPSLEYKTRSGNMARRIIDQLQPDVIIAVDDNAQEYVTRHYINDPKISLVFSAVNGQPADYGFDKGKNVTGILERIPLTGLKDGILLLSQKKKLLDKERGIIRIAHISDASKTVNKDDEHFKSFKNWGDKISLEESRLVRTFPEWKKAIIDAETSLDFIIISNYRTLERSDTSTEQVPPEEVMAWTTQNAKVPFIGVNGFVVTDGGGLAIATSPYEQGEEAAKIAVRILNDKKIPSDIPVMKTRQFIVYMRPEVMKKQNMDLPLAYAAFSRATNKLYE